MSKEAVLFGFELLFNHLRGKTDK